LVEVLVHEPVRERYFDDFLGQPSVVLELAGVQRDDPGQELAWAPYEIEAAQPRRRVTLTAIPYPLWANRGPSVMRIFSPASSS